MVTIASTCSYLLCFLIKDANMDNRDISCQILDPFQRCEYASLWRYEMMYYTVI